MKYAGAWLALLLTIAGACAVDAQDLATRAAEIEQTQTEKAAALHPFTPNKAEEWVNRAFNMMLSAQLHLHPFFTSPYSGGGFVVGAGYMRYVSPYNLVDVRGAITPSGYKRVETELLAPRLLHRTSRLSLVGGWREATQVGFYGFGATGETPDHRANYAFQQPYASALLEVRPSRGVFLLRGGAEATQWKQTAPSGSDVPAVSDVYQPDTLPGLGASPVYLHSQGTVGIDSRPSIGYARYGGFYGITAHDYADSKGEFGFDQVDYEITQHIPILREAWVVSLHGLAQTTYTKGSQQIPFFMMPAVGGGSDLRAFSSWRFRDQNTVLLQAEWRVMISRFLDLALFYDTGKATARRSDLDLHNLRSDYGFGFRLHGPMSTPVRLELAKGNEGMALVLGASHAF
jgi:hypothetical protein